MFAILFSVMSFMFSVFGEDGWPLILVNRVELGISKKIDGNGNRLATYNYLNGDFVDITCMRPNDVGIYNVTISGVKALHEKLEVDQLSSTSRVGFRTTLRTRHNDTKLTCTCSQDGGEYRVSVMIKLVTQDIFDDVMNLKINDMPIRSLGNNIYKYYYSNSENITLICERNKDDVMLTESMGTNANELENNESKKEKRFQWSTTPDEIPFTYRAYVNEASKPNRSIIIKFKRLRFWYNDASEIPLSLNFSTNKVLLDVYSIKGYQYIVYEYKDDEDMTLTCSTTDVIKKNGYVLSLDEKVQGNLTSISANIQLREQNNAKLECSILHNQPNLPIEDIRRIIVYFYKSTEISNTSSVIIPEQTERDFHYWILLVFGAVVCISICIYVIWNKKKQQNISIQRAAKHPGVERAEDLYSEPNKPEALYSVPFKPKPEALYSVPFKPEPEALYSNTLHNIPEPNYAVLDIGASTNVSRNDDNETTLYAEMCHDSDRYVNIL